MAYDNTYVILSGNRRSNNGQPNIVNQSGVITVGLVHQSYSVAVSCHHTRTSISEYLYHMDRKPVNLSQLTEQEKKQFREKYDNFFFDVDGMDYFSNRMCYYFFSFFFLCVCVYYMNYVTYHKVYFVMS